MRTTVRITCAGLILLAACDFGFYRPEGEQLKQPTGPPISVVDPNYVVLRPVFQTSEAEATSSATVHGATFRFGSSMLLNLSHFDLRTAEVQPAGTDASKRVISLRTTPEGSRILGEWSQRNIDKQLGVFLDGTLIDAPRIQSRIDTMIVLENDFTEQQAAAVVARLRRGGAT